MIIDYLLRTTLTRASPPASSLRVLHCQKSSWFLPKNVVVATNKMRPSLVARLGCLCLFSSSATSLPFTRGTKKDDNDDKKGGGAQAIIQDGNVISVTMPKDRRNPVVDKFFEDPTKDDASERLLQQVKQLVANQTDFLVSTRRTLHKHPELMYNEEQTSAVIESILRDLEIPFTTGWAANQHPKVFPGKGGHGIVADIGNGQAPCVLLRADIDALPIFERTQGIEEFRSRNDGCMHACGHDGHATMLIGAAAVLKSMESSIQGTGESMAICWAYPQ